MTTAITFSRQNDSGSRMSTSRRLVVSLQNFEHFDIISVVFESIDHRNLMSVHFSNNIDGFQHPFQVLFHEKSCGVRETEKKLHHLSIIFTIYALIDQLTGKKLVSSNKIAQYISINWIVMPKCP